MLAYTPADRLPTPMYPNWRGPSTTASSSSVCAGCCPGDVRVTAVTLAPEHFDARFAAIQRRYAYRICDLPGGVDPLRRHDVLQHLRPLDVSAMDQAAQRLTGEHDFASFCKKREGCVNDSTTHRVPLEPHVRGRRWSRDGCGARRGGCFLSQHGSIAGRREPLGWRGPSLGRLAGGDIAASGALVLGARGGPPWTHTRRKSVYPPDDQLLARTQQTRRRRGP